jgi:hypothetical protein
MNYSERTAFDEMMRSKSYGPLPPVKLCNGGGIQMIPTTASYCVAQPWSFERSAFDKMFAQRVYGPQPRVSLTGCKY